MSDMAVFRALVSKANVTAGISSVSLISESAATTSTIASVCAVVSGTVGASVRAFDQSLGLPHAEARVVLLDETTHSDDAITGVAGEICGNRSGVKETSSAFFDGVVGWYEAPFDFLEDFEGDSEL